MIVIFWGRFPRHPGVVGIFLGGNTVFGETLGDPLPEKGFCSLSPVYPRGLLIFPGNPPFSPKKMGKKAKRKKQLNWKRGNFKKYKLGVKNPPDGSRQGPKNNWLNLKKPKTPKGENPLYMGWGTPSFRACSPKKGGPPRGPRVPNEFDGHLFHAPCLLRPRDGIWETWCIGKKLQTPSSTPGPGGRLGPRRFWGGGGWGFGFLGRGLELDIFCSSMILQRVFE